MSEISNANRTVNNLTDNTDNKKLSYVITKHNSTGQEDIIIYVHTGKSKIIILDYNACETFLTMTLNKNKITLKTLKHIQICPDSFMFNVNYATSYDDGETIYFKDKRLYWTYESDDNENNCDDSLALNETEAIEFYNKLVDAFTKFSNYLHLPKEN